MNGPVYVEPFAGAAAVWLRLLNPSLVPPVSWMGGKRRLADSILGLLGLTPGRPVPAILGDASWWGWVWPVVLDPITGPRVSAVLRSWRGEDPRALWFRLRDAGPADDLAERAAGLLWLQARAASGVPVWWEGEAVRGPGYNTGQAARDGRRRLAKWDRTRAGNVGPANQTHAAELVQDRGWKGGANPTRTPFPATQSKAAEPRLVQWASTQIDDAGQRQAREACAKGYIGGPGRLVAGARGDRPQDSYAAGHKGKDSKGGGGIVDPGTVADRLDAVRLVCDHRVPGPAGEGGAAGPDDVADRLDAVRGHRATVEVHHADALELVLAVTRPLGARGRYFLDPPYLGCTGYPAECPRERVLKVAEECARHGGRVVLSEAVDLSADLGPGWRAVQLRRGKRPEWVTTYRCDVRAVHGPLFAEARP